MDADTAGNLAICSDLEGNPDLYGIGIRLGVYLSWFATLLANTLITSRIEDVSDTNTLFVVANFIAVAVASHSSGGELNVVDVYIVLTIFFGYIFGGWSLSGLRLGRIYHTDPYDDSRNWGCNEALEVTISKRIRLSSVWIVELHESFSQIGIFIRLALALAIASYGVWFAYTGAPQLAPAECTPIIFLFGQREFFGPVLTFLKVLTAGILVLIIFVSLPVVAVFLKAAFINFIGVLGCVLCLIFCQDERGSRAATGETDKERAAEEEQWRREDCNELWMCFNIFCMFLASGLNMSRKDAPPGPDKSKQFYDPAPEHICHTLRWREHNPVIVMFRCMTAFILGNLRQALGCVGLIISLWTIIVIEMTISYNGMPRVNQLIVTSQLIPFVVGLGLLLTVLHRLFFEYVDPAKRREREEAEVERQKSTSSHASPVANPQTPSDTHDLEQGLGQTVATQPSPVAPMSVPTASGQSYVSASPGEALTTSDQRVMRRTSSGRAYIVDMQTRTTYWADEPPPFEEVSEAGSA